MKLLRNLSHTKEELEQAKADKEKSRSEYDSVESAIAEFDRSVEKKKEIVMLLMRYIIFFSLLTSFTD